MPPPGPEPERPPFPGLEPYGEEDAEFFFGRDREIQRLLEKLKSSAFLAVVRPGSCI
jgi:hypothetical protein